MEAEVRGNDAADAARLVVLVAVLAAQALGFGGLRFRAFLAGCTGFLAVVFI